MTVSGIFHKFLFEEISDQYDSGVINQLTDHSINQAVDQWLRYLWFSYLDLNDAI